MANGNKPPAFLAWIPAILMIVTICGTMMTIHLYWMSEIRRVENKIPPAWFKERVDQTTKMASDNSRNITVIMERMQTDDEEINDLEQRVRALERSK